MKAQLDKAREIPERAEKHAEQRSPEQERENVRMIVREALKQYFPWLGSDEQLQSCADQVEVLGQMYEDMGGQRDSA